MCLSTVTLITQLLLSPKNSLRIINFCKESLFLVNLNIFERCTIIYSFKTVITRQITTEQRVFIVKHWFITRSIEQVRLLFRERFPDREPPTRMAIWKNVKNTPNMGSRLNRNSGHPGRPRTGRSQENIDRVQELLGDNPRGVSSCRNGLGISQSSFVRILVAPLQNEGSSPAQNLIVEFTFLMEMSRWAFFLLILLSETKQALR